jgi:hypothetical protein
LILVVASAAAQTPTNGIVDAASRTGGSQWGWSRRPRGGGDAIVIVLFAERDGMLRRVATNGRLGTASGFDGRPSLEIRKGVLVANANFGNGWATDVTYRFRYDTSSHAMMLIGYDQEVYSRAGVDDAFRFSENYLTGVRVETVRHVDRRKKKRRGVYASETSTRTTIERYRVAFDDVVFAGDVSDDESADGRPFAH